MYNNLVKKVGKGITFRNLKDDTRVLEAVDSKQSNLLQELVENKDPNSNLNIGKNETLNACHGTILVPNSLSIGNKDFSECSDLIKENIELQDIKIQDLQTYIRPPRGIRKYPLRIAKIVFAGRTLPERVVIGGEALSVKEYIPSPRQCGKCWKYGHGIKYCRSENFVCPICGEHGHLKNSCNSNTKLCVNCKGEHPAFSRSCQLFKREELITKTTFKEGLTYKAAKKKLLASGELQTLNFANIVGKIIQSKPHTRPNTNTVMPSVKHSLPTPISLNNRYDSLDLFEDGIMETVSQSLPDINTSTPKPQRQRSKRSRENNSDEERKMKKVHTSTNKVSSSPESVLQTIETVAQVHKTTDEFHSFDEEDTVVYEKCVETNEQKIPAIDSVVEEPLISEVAVPVEAMKR